MMPSPSPAISGSALDVGASSSFTIEVLFFGSARDAVGNVSAITLGLPEGSDTATLRRSLAARYPKLKDVVLDEDNITLALNEEYVTGTTPLKQGDVVALIPPISGG